MDAENIASRLGGKVKGKIKVTAGYLGAAALAAEVKRRFKTPRGGGRATDPEWTELRLVRFKKETLIRLKQLASQASGLGPHVEPIQVAALIIELVVDEITQ